MRSTWGTSLGEDKLGARDKILNTKVARRACAGNTPDKHSPEGKKKIPVAFDLDFEGAPPCVSDPPPPREIPHTKTRDRDPVHQLWGRPRGQ